MSAREAARLVLPTALPFVRFQLRMLAQGEAREVPLWSLRLHTDDNCRDNEYCDLADPRASLVACLDAFVRFGA